MKKINSLNSFDSERGKYTEQQLKLSNYLLKLPKFPHLEDHKAIAKSFGVQRYRDIFRVNAYQRFISEVSKETLTGAAISKRTGIAHKYLCQIKRNLEKQGLIEVVDLGRCPVTGSVGVQFLTSNKNLETP